MGTAPRVSVIVLAWNNLELTRACIRSLRRGTRSPSELVVVDNGSTPPAVRFAEDNADRAVLLPENLGFAAGMNRGLEVASGDVVAFVNNDTVFPSAWDVSLLEHFADEQVGIVAPAVTAAGNPVTVRDRPGTDVERLLPFGEFPSGVVYLLRRSVALELGGWNERYPIASAEDLDLCFTVWANGLDVVLDTRVLVEHVSQATVRDIPDRRELYMANLELFLARWEDPDNEVPRLPSTPVEILDQNRARARTAVRWIRRMLEARREAASLRHELEELQRPEHPHPVRGLRRLLRRVLG